MSSSLLLLLLMHVHMNWSLFLSWCPKLSLTFSQIVILFFKLKVALSLKQRSNVAVRRCWKGWHFCTGNSTITVLSKICFCSWCCCCCCCCCYDGDDAKDPNRLKSVSSVTQKNGQASLSLARARSKSRLPAPDFSLTHSCETQTPGSGVTLGSAATATWYPCTLA